MPLDDLNFQNMNPTQNKGMLGPVNLVAAATLAPLTFLTIVTGTTAGVTITPPVSGIHVVAIVTVTTNFGGFTTAGNILAASVTNGTTWDNKVSIFVYNPLLQKYYPQYPVGGTNF